jgi:hypothetical protein
MWSVWCPLPARIPADPGRDRTGRDGRVTPAVFDSATAAQRFATTPISYAGDPSSMEELADRVGELKAAKSDLDAYLERLKALFIASGRDEAEGVLFRVVLSAESVATTVDRKAIEAAMGESSLARFLKFGKPSRSFNCYARTAKAKRAA